jgi:hypothetical protein
VAWKKFLRSIDMRQATQPNKHFYFKSFRLPRACIVASLIELGVARPPIIKWLLYKHLSCVWEELEGLFPPRVLITRGKKKFFRIIPKGGELNVSTLACFYFSTESFDMVKVLPDRRHGRDSCSAVRVQYLFIFNNKLNALYYYTRQGNHLTKVADTHAASIIIKVKM